MWTDVSCQPCQGFVKSKAKKKYERLGIPSSCLRSFLFTLFLAVFLTRVYLCKPEK